MKDQDNLEFALRWSEGQPYSPRFDDKYYCNEDGLNESLYTFCEGNDLVARFGALTEDFIVGETGFGTGLNFLTCWTLWNQKETAPHWLHFYSIEGFPLTQRELTRCHQQWPVFEAISRQFLERYSPTSSGCQEMCFERDRVKCTIFYAGVIEALDQMGQKFPVGKKADAWFLDGFAPAKNPEMWSVDVFSRLTGLSRPGTTLSTFTVAGDVRRGLNASGFQTGKAKGFGRKRQMLKGKFDGGRG